ncbi:MAG: bifunctional [glutamate--ammonia ligase]-adenylyl-L-tyrosine phosphorylase/[glutamate--ammonia-ligase] adenylyltransferase [Bdellovibrio sp.]|nr:bifunctional [glutamate--ammonia ligase]-adenylyl-L-tyrosine phosphorylase/[glutamate--ammonia-ligase] adenylyltransferase [Methylotenera sp.]
MLTLENLLTQTHANASFRAGIAYLCDCSLWAKHLLAKDANLLDDLLQNHAKIYLTVEMQPFLDAAIIIDEASLKKALRQLRQRVLLRTMYRDLNGLADLNEVMQTTSTLAEVTLIAALKCHHTWLQAIYGEPCSLDGTPQHLIIVGMGKLGGRELNVSSDIDLIFAFESDGATVAGHDQQTISNQDYFTKLAKKLISAMDETTEDGFVFRVDMRLRPFGGEGVLVSNLNALEEYYQNNGREWERYAWIKGRALHTNNHIGLQSRVETLLNPFIFRKYLDFGAFASMRDLKMQIQRDVNSKGMQDNIKLGRGGIREIEFIAQVFQLIRGGQEISLQIKPTLSVLNLLQNKGLLPQKTVSELTEAYIFLRNCEHRLMYVDDAQTHELPKTNEAKARIAKSMHFADWTAFLTQLNVHRKNTQQHFDATFKVDGQAENVNETAIWQGLIDTESALQALSTAGFGDAAQTFARLQMLRNSSRYQQLPALSRQRFDALMPHTIAQAALMPNPDVTLLRVTDVFESICRRASYLALLAEHPRAMHLLVKLCSSSPWLTNYLAQHPILLDELLDTRTLYAAPNFAAMRAELLQRMSEFAGDVERQMDAMRHFKHANVFRLAVQDINGELTLEALSDYLSALADLILSVALEIIWPNVKGAQGVAPKFAVIGYGKLGSKELGYASDLDIIFLYEEDVAVAAENLAEVFARFAQRISSWFNTLTSAGLLYETDLQLRPDGNSGLLVSSVSAFREYQLKKAWVWEHQALTRARFVAGDASIGGAFEAIRIEVLTQSRDAEKLKTEVIAMREKMRAAQAFVAGMFDIKHSIGGIIDVEFLVQYLVLANAKKYPQLTDNKGNIALLKRLGMLQIIDNDLAEKTAVAYREYRLMQHAFKLQGATQMRVNYSQVNTHASTVNALWMQVFAD